MKEQENPTRECPLCREEIQADAVRCKHCHGEVTPEAPPHGGICPLCKEAIHPEAIRCKHCQADLTPANAGCGCCDARALPSRRSRRYPRRPVGPVEQGPVIARSVPHGPNAGNLLPSCAGCPAWVDDGGWFGILVGCGPGDCEYEEY